VKGKRFLPEALQQELRRLHQQLGTVRLSEKLAVAPQTLRSMLLVERQTPKMIERVEQMLPQVCGYAKETKDHRSVLSPLYLDRLRVLMQITRLHQLRFALDRPRSLCGVQGDEPSHRQPDGAGDRDALHAAVGALAGAHRPPRRHPTARSAPRPDLRRDPCDLRRPFAESLTEPDAYGFHPFPGVIPGVPFCYLPRAQPRSTPHVFVKHMGWVRGCVYG